MLMEISLSVELAFNTTADPSSANLRTLPTFPADAIRLDVRQNGCYTSLHM